MAPGPDDEADQQANALAEEDWFQLGALVIRELTAGTAECAPTLTQSEPARPDPT
jgi:hypothetical protein